MGPFASVETIHYGTVEWWWADSVSHDDAYRERVQDAVTKAVDEAEEKFGVQQETRFCTQFEGVQVFAETMQAAQSAAQHIERALRRFKRVRPTF